LPHSRVSKVKNIPGQRRNRWVEVAGRTKTKLPWTRPRAG
jgi:hypothetical protein